MMIGCGGERVASQPVIVDVVIAIFIAYACATKRRWIHSIGEFYPRLLTQTHGTRYVRRQLGLQGGAGVEEHGSNFFRVETHTHVDTALVLLLEGIVYIVFAGLVAQNLVADVRVVGVGQNDGGGSLNTVDAIEGIFFQTATLHDPLGIFLIQSVEVDVLDHDPLHGFVGNLSLGSVVFREAYLTLEAHQGFLVLFACYEATMDKRIYGFGIKASS